MGTLSLVLDNLKDLEECMDDGDSRVAKEAKLFDALEHKSVVIEVDNKKIAIFTKVPLWAFEKVLENMGFVHVSLSDYCRKMVNDVIMEIHGEKFKADFVVLDYVNKEEPYILFGRDFLATTKSQEESKPILEVLENYVVYKKKLDEILVSKERLNKKEFSEEDKVGIIEHGLPKKMCDIGNYVLPVKINGYQAYMVDLLILDIPVDPELPLLLERPFLRTCEAIIDMGRGTLCIDDRVIHHTYFPKPQLKSYIEAFEMEGEDD
nr:hypothetical protein [Tanacetum cinerariifolium]